MPELHPYCRKVAVWFYLVLFGDDLDIEKRLLNQDNPNYRRA